jgi:hypothetical protein
MRGFLSHAGRIVADPTLNKDILHQVIQKKVRRRHACEKLLDGSSIYAR